MSFIQNNIISLRPVEPEDINLLYIWENNIENWIFGNTNVPFSKFTLKQFIDKSTNDIFIDKQLRLMIDEKSTENTVGTIDLFDFDPINNRAAIGILIAQNYRNNKYAENALNLISLYSFNVLNLYQIYANISENNLISINLFQKLNYTKSSIRKNWININGKWINEITLQLFNPKFQNK